MQDQSSATRETIAKKALRLYPERIVEPLGHGRYSVEGSDGFYEVDLGIFNGGEESCPCIATKPCYHISLATIHRAKSRVKARREQHQRAASRAARGHVASLTSLS
jgi:hypothetical protein